MTFKRKQFVCHKDTKAQRNYIKKTWCLSDLVARRKGMTLTEMAVVIGIVAIMVGLTLPAANVLYNSFESTSGAKSMLNAALASAKSIAIKEQRYAGIRFQKRYDPVNVLNAPQYMIFIIYDHDVTGLANGFCAVDGIQPIKLPDSIGVMDSNVADNFAIDTDSELSNNTTFSIIFSPSGKLVIHNVRTRYRTLYDDTFNTLGQLTATIPAGMFLQDDGATEEQSRNSFIIYETKKLKQVPYNNRWDGYLKFLKPVYVNPYMGTIVE
ncbi:MAG: prepilin-type N-terminal cleavage/methylation domain-containing protein [Sedimentisphaerales bacterium]